MLLTAIFLPIYIPIVLLDFYIFFPEDNPCCNDSYGDLNTFRQGIKTREIA